jgi:hypothetical protein
MCSTLHGNICLDLLFIAAIDIISLIKTCFEHFNSDELSGRSDGVHGVFRFRRSSKLALVGAKYLTSTPRASARAAAWTQQFPERAVFQARSAEEKPLCWAATGQGVVNDEHDNSPNNCNDHAVKIEPGDPRSTE